MRQHAEALFVVPKNKKLGYFSLFVSGLLLCVTWSVLKPAGAYAASDDYPSKWRDVPMDSVLDDWRMYNRECVSFVAWRLHTRNGFEMPFHDSAANWKSRASSMGYAVNATPAIGAVAWSSNHVAWVEAVGNGTVTVEEYNNIDSNHNGSYGDDGTYSTRTIAPNSMQYIHFKDTQNPQGTSTSGINAELKGSSALSADETLWAGQYILSNNVLYALVMQGDGNLVLYGNGMQPLWSSGTAGSGANRVVMQSDGNLVLYTSDDKAVWNSRTNGRGSSTLYMQDDGNAVVYSSSGSTWNSHTGGHPTLSYFGNNGLAMNQTMNVGQYIKSNDSRYALLLQGDGNLVLYSPGYHILWSSGTSGSTASFLAMQPDGNLVLYTSSNQALWSSGTAGRGNSFTVLQSDGNLVVYTSNGAATWHTHTNGKI